MISGQTEGLRTLFVSGLDGDTRRYRCMHHQEQLASLGVETGFRESDDPQLLVDVLDYDIFVLHRVPYSQLIGIVVDIAHLRGKPVIFETDDLVFAPELYKHIGFVDTLSAEDARKYRNDLERLGETFQRCDCVLTTTQFLADEARQRGRPAYIHRNAPNGEMVSISEQVFSNRREQLEEGEEEARPVVIAFFSGTGSHNRDFKAIADPVIRVLEAYPQAWLHISGHLELGPEFSSFQTRVRRAPYVSWRELPHLIAQADINLVPLEQENPFCQAKSENKFVEAALVGVPTIASRVGAYEFAITAGRDGLLAASSQEWESALRALLNDPDRRREIGEAARRTAYERYMPEQHAPRLLETLQEITHQYASSSAPTERLLREMTVRVRQYADQMCLDGSSQEDQIASLRRVVDQYESQLVSLSRLVERREQTIEKLEQTIEAIMQGRVMRFTTCVERWVRKIRGK